VAAFELVARCTGRLFGDSLIASGHAHIHAGLQETREQGRTLGDPKVDDATQAAIQRSLKKGVGIKKTTATLGCGIGIVIRVRNGDEPGCRATPATRRALTAHGFGLSLIAGLANHGLAALRHEKGRAGVTTRHRQNIDRGDTEFVDV